MQHYIRDLVHGMPDHIAGGWERRFSRYSNVFYKIASVFCKNPQIQGDLGIIKVTFSQEDIASDQAVDQKLATVNLPPAVRQLLDHSPLRIVWVYINTAVIGNQMSHACMLMFDKETKTQVLFDPDWDVNYPIPSGLCRRRFHPDYINLPASVCGWAQHNACIQRVIEAELHPDEHGVCGILCILVMLCCNRFNFYNPKAVADYIKHTLSERGTMNMFISWYTDLLDIVRGYNPATNAHIAAYLLRLQMDEETVVKRRCGVYNNKTGRICSRTSCDTCMCWQHRFLLTNKQGNTKRCKEVYSGCGGAPAPRTRR